MTIADDIIALLVSADVQAAIDATDKRPMAIVHINGIVTDVDDLTVRHGVDAPIGTCSLSLPLPLSGHVAQGATIDVQLGYPGLMYTVFRGSIPTRDRSFSISGGSSTISAVSAGSLLARQDYTDVSYPGPISLRTLFQSMCRRRGVTSYRADATMYPDGSTEIRFGNNLNANKNKVVVPRKTTSLAFLADAAKLFGYRVFDTPGGVRLQRVSGLPDAGALLSVSEAWNARELGHSDDISGLVNYWEVFGSRYTDPDGVTVAIRSIPASVPYDARLAPQGWARGELSGELLDTIALADAARNAAEIDHSAPYEPVTWETHGAPHILPGDVANVTSPIVEIAGKQWVISVEHTWNRSGGFRTRCDGWRGAGTALPAGQDCVTTSIPGGCRHVGDEYLSHYRNPNPNGLVIKIAFTVVENYSSIAVRCLAHGTNSYLLDNANTESSVSQFEVWQFGVKVGSGPLPVLAEDLNRRLPYGPTDTYWSHAVVPVTGSLEPGAAELRIISGKDARASGGPQDDFEIDQITITLCGIGSPVLPTPTP